MTTEQKEATDLVKCFTKKNFSNENGWTGYYDTELKELQQAIEIVLNLIQEQEKEIEASRQITTEMNNDVKKLIIECKKKNKIIDLMAKAFKQDDVRSVEEIKQFYERKVENEEN